MKFQIKSIACAITVLASIGAATPSAAQISDDVVKIGFITDIGGPYSDIDGVAGVEAVKMAIADFGGTVNGKKIEFVYADHQNKADVAASKAREFGISREAQDDFALQSHRRAAAAQESGRFAEEIAPVFPAPCTADPRRFP